MGRGQRRTSFPTALGDHHETSAPQILASGIRRCRAAGRVASRQGASVSDAADYDHCRGGCGRTDGYHRTHYHRAQRNALGQTIVIENNGAAAGSIAHGRAARAAPDGYTLSLGHWGTHVVNGAVYTLAYDVLKDFEPVALISSSTYFMVGKRDLPANDLKDLVAWLKASPDKVTQGTPGAGSPGHIGGILLQSILGVRWTFVPYRGANPVMQALLAGDYDWTFTTPDQGLPQIHAGRVKAYAITAKQRMALAPDVPTTDEAGLPGFYLSYWHGLWAPKGTPKEIVGKLNAAVVSAFGRAGRSFAAHRARTGDFPARAADTGDAWHAAEGRNRKVVAARQSGRHQTGMMRTKVGYSRAVAPLRSNRRVALPLTAWSRTLSASWPE
jgi:tripartite-type tricarboxylate transporter receptor subunit TctC